MKQTRLVWALLPAWMASGAWALDDEMHWPVLVSGQWRLEAPSSSLGLTLRPSSFSPGGLPLGPAGGAGLDLGLRWNATLHRNWQVDLTAWRRLGLTSHWRHEDVDGGLYGGRVEMQFHSTPRLGLVPEMRAIGLQLEGGGKLMLRARGGRPVIYYRATF